MGKIRAYLNLIVPAYIPMAITTFILGFVASNGKIILNLEFLLGAFSIIFIISAFNSFNAISDKEIDKINQPNRPIPKNELTENQALIFTIILYAIALLVSTAINTTFFVIALITVILTIAYSYPYINLKKKFIIGTLSVTILYAVLCFLMGWAIKPSENINFPILVFLFMIGYSLAITKDFMDVKGDYLYKAKTIPVKLGHLKSVTIVAILVTISFIFIIFLITQKFLDEKFFYALSIFPLMLLNIAYTKEKDYLNSRKIFNRSILLLILLEIVLIALFII